MKASEFAGLIHECSSEVLDAMYFTSVIESAPLRQLPDRMPGTEEPLAFSLTFAGDISGRFGIHLDQMTARTLAVNFLGETACMSFDEISEVAGELSNILCGSVMSRVEGEHLFALSHPVPGTPTLSSTDDLLACWLNTDCGHITVWIMVEGVPCFQ